MTMDRIGGDLQAFILKSTLSLLLSHHTEGFPTVRSSVTTKISIQSKG